MVYVAPVTDYAHVRPSHLTHTMPRTTSSSTDEGVSMEDQMLKNEIAAMVDAGSEDAMTCATQGDCYDVPSLLEIGLMFD